MMPFLTLGTHNMCLKDFMAVITVENEFVPQSNQWNEVINLTCGIELFFASVANGGNTRL